MAKVLVIKYLRISSRWHKTSTKYECKQILKTTYYLSVYFLLWQRVKMYPSWMTQVHIPFDPAVHLTIISSAQNEKSEKVRYCRRFFPVSKRLLAKKTIAAYFLQRESRAWWKFFFVNTKIFGKLLMRVELYLELELEFYCPHHKYTAI